MPYAYVNGFKMYYEMWGHGEPVIFIHGIAVTSRMWEFQKKEIGKHFCMIIYDLRGSGKSSKTLEVQHTAELFADDLKEFMDYLNIDRFNIVGISLGAAVAMKFAIKHPQKVKSLVISGAFVDFKHVLSFISKHFAGIIGRLLMTRLFGELATKIMLPSASKEELLYYHRNIISVDRDEIKKYRQVLNSYSITPALEKISAPTLVLHGTYEFPLHKYGRIIHKYVQNSKMMIIPGVGHGWNGEKSELFNKIIMDFINANMDK